MGADQTIRATVITVSDEIHSGMDGNRAGLLAVELLGRHDIHTDLVVVPDDVGAIRMAVEAARAAGSRLVMTSGGTGIGPADVTIEAVAPLLAYQLPGIAEEIRRRGAATVASALVSREIAGVILGAPSVFVLAAPGSRGGVRDAIDVVGPLLAHIVAQLDGAGHH
ncbi:MAG: MogA/MoaB family molybdenum cofactor biosynthesis protein [Propionibacteriaceae bacterium]|nr:MogA/MoaB family molybdenum cofactor biosynthesis protein [Propionibacteriaceae bacterium]